MINLKDIKLKKFMSKCDVNKLISSSIELIDDVYLGNNYSHNWKCKCGETIKGRQWGNIRFRNDILCEKCVKQKTIDRYKLEVEKVEGYKFIKAYFVGDKLPSGEIVKRHPYIEVKHEYCGSVYTIIANNFIGAKQSCSNCCGSYEHSLAYYIEVTLEESLDKYIDLEKSKYNPYFLHKNSSKKLWFFCQKNPNHKSSPKSCGDFVNGIKRDSGCKYCRNNDTHKLDSIGYKFPYLASMIVGNIDVFSLAPQSNEKFHLKCPNCGHISKHKIEICNLVNQGYSCKVCGDGISIPEKFMYNILLNLDIDFYNRKIFEWSNNKEYDFYIPSLNIIIETHGGQHYYDGISFNSTSLKDQQINDKNKYNLAIKNIPKENYYVIDCRHSDFEFLKHNIIKTLNSVFVFSDIDWNLAWQNSQKSLCKKSWDLWNSGLTSTILIANELKLARITVIRYLKNGSKLGLCDYNSKEEMKKSALANACNNQKLKCTFPNSEIKYFNSIAKLLEYLNISKRSYNKIMANDGVVNINIFCLKKTKEKLLKYNMCKIELL